MDTVMLVIESEKTDRDVVQQANQLLLQSKANVSAVLNKTRKYVPARLQHDLNAVSWLISRRALSVEIAPVCCRSANTALPLHLPA